MSHSSIQKSEPNLVPMLDLVLQLIMFFILCANFIANDLNENIKLPAAIQARLLDRNEDYVITLNMDSHGRILLVKADDKLVEEILQQNRADPRILTNKAEVAQYMAGKMLLDKERIEQAKRRGVKVEPRPSLVVLRADKQATYKMVNDVLEACRVAGYSDVQLRTKIEQSSR